MPFDLGPVESPPSLGVQRLLRLADYLETVPPELYAQESWRTRTSCGTVCCAFGHAVTGLGRELGLRWRGPGSDVIDRITGPREGGQENLTLAQEVFELTYDDAVQLFGTEGYYHRERLDGIDRLTPKDVAAGLRAFAQDKLVKEKAYAV